MKNTGIPTIYRGRQYRSRLEARWAAMFNLMGWKHEYEPFDLGGWVPDFALIGKEGMVLAEVKPVTSFPEEVAEKIQLAADGMEHELLIIGCMVPLPDGEEESFGWVGENYGVPVGPDIRWMPAHFGRWKAGDGRIGFCSETGSFHDRVSGGYDGGSHGGRPFAPTEAWALWTLAGNMTQWRGKQSVVS